MKAAVLRHTGSSLGTGRKETNKQVAFTQDMLAHFTCLCSASEVDKYQDLCGLIVLEQFKNLLPV